MTLAHKTQPNKPHALRRGFTLLEIITTMLIVSILIGSAVLFFVGENDEHVEKLSIGTQQLARDTMRSAKEEQRAYSLYLSETAIWAEPEMAQGTEGEPIRKGSLSVAEDVRISYQLNAQAGWSRVGSQDNPLVWTFTKTGLCEPLTLRFENETAVDTISFHPLTAGKILDEN